MKMKKLLALVCALALTLACALPAAGLAEETAKTPKYVFMFIGDAMGSPQVTATQYYLGAIENPDSPVPVAAELSFTEWTNVGLMTTYDATSFNPDSASTASADAALSPIVARITSARFTFSVSVECTAGMISPTAFSPKFASTVSAVC